MRLKYFLDLLIAAKHPVMLVGNAGTGKTVLMQAIPIISNVCTQNNDSLGQVEIACGNDGFVHGCQCSFQLLHD